MFKVITVEREYGAGGSLVAIQLAKRLGWEVLDQKLTNEIARLADVDHSAVKRCDEHIDPLTHRLAKVFWRGSNERMLPLDDNRVFDTDRMVRLATQIIEGAAKNGNCVIVGRGAPYILRNHRDAFHVFCYAPRHIKVERLMGMGMSESECEKLVDVIDNERAQFVKRYYGKQWPHRPLYNLMVNTAFGIDPSVDLILSAMQITTAQYSVTK